MGWSEDSVPLHTHACFYYADEAALRSTLSFLRVGLDAKDEFNVVFADAGRHQALLGWLQDGYAGDVASAVEAGKLELIGGAPTLEQLLSNIGARLEAAVARGYRLIRFLGFIAWGEPGWPDEGDLLEFESRVNAAVRSFPAVIVCTYGVPSLTGRQLIDGGLMTHPVVFLDDRVLTGNPLQRNPAPKPVE